MHMRRCALLSLPVLAFAMDPATSPHWDVRALLSSAPGIDEYSSGSYTWEYSDGSGVRFGVEVVYTRTFESGFGFHAGPGIYVASHKGKDTLPLDVTLEDTVNAVALGGQAGASFAFNRLYQIDVGLRVLAGSATVTLQTVDYIDYGSYVVANTSEEKSDAGSYLDYDIVIGNHFTLDNGLQLGFELGYSAWNTTVKFDGSDDVDFKGAGMFGGGTIGYRW